MANIERNYYYKLITETNMKILVFNWQCIRNPFGGGAEVHMHEIFKRIVAMGHNVTIFCCKVPGLPDEEIIDGTNVIRRGKRSTFNFIVKRWYRKRFSKEKYDIIIDDINKIPFYTPRYVKEPLLAISHHFFGASIYHEANAIAGTYVVLAEKLIDQVYRETQFAVVSESTLQEFIDRGFDRRNFSIITNAIEATEFPMAVGNKNNKPTISYFGRLKKYKSIDHLLKAFAIVRKSIPESQLHILGRGDYRQQLEGLAESLGIAHCTTFFGFVSNEDKIKLLSQSHIVVNTSLKEGWGITNIEANACGTPVISANVPGLRDSVNDGQSGLLYPYGDVDELAEKIMEVLMSEELLQNLSQGAVDWASSFSWNESARLMLQRCLEVIAIHRQKKR